MVRCSAAATLALLVGVATVGIGWKWHGSGRQHRGVALPADLRSRLFFLAGQQATEVVRADGTVVQRFPQLAAAGYPVQPVVTADHLVVFVHRGQAYRLGPDLRAPAQRVGPADRLFPADGGTVGLEVGAQPRSVAYIAADGSGPDPGTTAVQLPVGSTAVGRLVGRLLTLSSDGHLRFGTGPEVELGPVSAIIGASYATVAWTARAGCADGACPLHISDLGGAERLVSPPPGFGGFVGGGAFSPDGTSLGAFVYAPTPRPTLRLILIDTATGRVQTIGPPLPAGEAVTVPQTDMTPWPITAAPIGSAQWSTDGAWLFFSGLSGPMYAQQIDRGDPVGPPVAMPLPASYAFAPL